MKKVVFKMEPFSCPSCADIIEKVLLKQTGIEEVLIQFFSNKIKIIFNEDQITILQIEEVLEKLGYSAVGRKVG
ncbi:heavy-metal-associated domain-containing protein [Anaerobacillus isosaccharinicus]|uniref:Heavy metal-binding protein n=1 Tax=Anaerobacillus isosaccharinicus TaxID=1532552 RepID=A0A1S2L5Z2_9BACI|nr:heavy-metal-associated domain-containing protein [Anaerobacillus isosaccharinicus]MBA5584868.1 heavy-metal-associated domain-containing protein [Anaerobacillus isosaccharinicus]QOY36771.1 heavy-metal-associated domain-containing protein [Anaerobacillus isosaccharinicus]